MAQVAAAGVVKAAGWRARLVALAVLACGGCLTTPAAGPGPKGESGFEPLQLAKTDIDRMADAHRREVFASVRLLAEKLYRRNPREWRRSGQPSLDAAVNRLFEPRHAWRLPEFDGRFGTDLVAAALREDFTGDRVGALAAGLGGMLHVAFGERAEFYITDDLDAQKLYHSARNLEIAAWRLAQAKDGTGAPLVLANEMTPAYNLSFEREFGKMIGNLDLLARIVADKNQRTIAKVIQNVASAVFIPIPGLK